MDYLYFAPWIKRSHQNLSIQCQWIIYRPWIGPLCTILQTRIITPKIISFQCVAIVLLCLAAANAVPDCDHGYSYPQPQVQLKVAPAVEAVSYNPGYSTYSAGPAVKYASVGPSYSAYSQGPAYSSVDYTPGVTYAKSSGIVLASQSPSAQYAEVAAPAVSYGVAKTLIAPAPVVTRDYLPPVAKVRRSSVNSIRKMVY